MAYAFSFSGVDLGVCHLDEQKVGMRKTVEAGLAGELGGRNFWEFCNYPKRNPCFMYSLTLEQRRHPMQGGSTCRLQTRCFVFHYPTHPWIKALLALSSLCCTAFVSVYTWALQVWPNDGNTSTSRAQNRSTRMFRGLIITAAFSSRMSKAAVRTKWGGTQRHMNIWELPPRAVAHVLWIPNDPQVPLYIRYVQYVTRERSETNWGWYQHAGKKATSPNKLKTNV